MRAPIDGSVILITGASSGIGVELARQLAGRARALVLVARRRKRLNELADSLRGQHADLTVHVAPCDLRDRAAIDALVEHLDSEVGPVDVLINNAGLGDLSVLDLAEPDKLDAMIEVNVTALTVLTRRLLPAMLERGRGGILNISSGFGLTFTPGMAVYVGTKHYVTGFTESLRTELRRTGVVLTQSCPGPVDTEFESVTGNPTGLEVPGLVRISAETCARQSLRGFERGRAMVVPGLLMRVLIFLGRWTPRPIMRLVYGPVGSALRSRQRALLADDGSAAAAAPDSSSS